MPKFAKLSSEEIEQLTGRRRPIIDLSEYMAFLGQFKTGEWGSIALEEGESQRVISNNLVSNKSGGW